MHLKQIAWYLLAPALLLSTLAAKPQQKAAAQQSNDPGQLDVPYGISINLADAMKVAAAAVAEANKQHWKMAIAITGAGGHLIYFERLDGNEDASVDMSIGKAQTAVLYRRATKTFEDRLAQGGDNLHILGMKGVVPLDGGIPLVADGKIVGAIGVSGGSSEEDGRCATAGASALK